MKLSFVLALAFLTLSSAQLLPSQNTTTTTTTDAKTTTSSTTPSPSSSPSTSTSSTSTSTSTTGTGTTGTTTTAASNTVTSPTSTPPQVTPPAQTATSLSDGVLVTITITSNASPSPSASPNTSQPNNDSPPALGIGPIIGMSVAGGIALIGIIAFVIWKMTRKRFTDFDDNEAIKWPELNAHGNPDSHPPPVNATGRAGFETGSGASLSRVTSSNFSTPDFPSGPGADPYAVPPLPHLNPNQPYRDDPSGASGYYDPYRGPVPGTLENEGMEWPGEVIPMTQMSAMRTMSPAPSATGRHSPAPHLAYQGRASPGPQTAYGYDAYGGK